MEDFARSYFIYRTAIMYRCRFMLIEKLLDPRIYAFVNEDAHSTIW